MSEDEVTIDYRGRVSTDDSAVEDAGEEVIKFITSPPFKIISFIAFLYHLSSNNIIYI